MVFWFRLVSLMFFPFCPGEGPCDETIIIHRSHAVKDGVYRFPEKSLTTLKRRLPKMWLDKLNAMKKSTNTRTKTLADAIHRSERTVGRMLAGEAGIDMSELQTMVSVMGGTLDDIFDGSDMRLPRPEVETLKKQIEALTEEIGILKAENAMLRDKNTALDTENDKLRLTLAHKEELLTLHSYYMGLRKGD
jgi:hypothetical protein